MENSRLRSLNLSRLFPVLLSLLVLIPSAYADSINSPNISLNVDTNRSAGAGAGNVSVTINTITIAETTLPEYSAGTGKAITFQVRPGYQFDTTSNVTAVSATLGINGGGLNAVASRTPTGAANETITFNLTSAATNSATVQDIIRVNGVKIKILSVEGAVGPAQTTMTVTTSAAGGAFTAQGIVAANIITGAADRLVFAVQPANTTAGDDLLPVVKIVDFGGNTVTNDARDVTLSIQTNPGPSTLLGTATVGTDSGFATWEAADHLRMNDAAAGYQLRASHSGAAFRTSDTADSLAFDITAGSPGGMIFSTQPVDTAAGDDILVAITLIDSVGNVATGSTDAITLETFIDPAKWPLTASTSLTKNAVAGVATWSAADDLKITKAIDEYRLIASGVGAPILSDEFDVTPNDANSVRFVENPVDIRATTTFETPVSVEVIDAFGNRVDSTALVSIELLEAPCGGSVSGNTATAVAGLATFSDLSFNKACADYVLAAVTTGLVATSSETFTVTAKNAFPVAVNLLELDPGGNARVVSRGAFQVSTATRDNPAQRGGSLTFTGDTASVRFGLPARGWSTLRNNGTVRGFQFRGSRVSGNKCRNVLVRRNLIEATCQLGQNTFQLPEPGPVDVILKLGTGSTRFCGRCGGTPIGDANDKFTRLSCEAASVCP